MLLIPFFKQYNDYFFVNNLPSSPIHNTRDVAAMIIPQSLASKGTVRNTSPPNVTIRICPANIIPATIIKPKLSFIPAKADFPVWKAFALNIFQNCSKTNTVKK